MKKIDRLVVFSFLGPLGASFLVALIAFTLQFFWLYIDELVGKGLEFGDVLRLLAYITAFSVSYSLPLAVLIASIMAYGKLSETSELVAMRSSGLSFGRIALSIGFISILLTLVAFVFNSYIIPWSNLKIISMRYDIISSKPAFDLEAGIFYDKLDGYVINTKEKHADNKRIKDVVIYQQQKVLQKDDDLIVAKSGDMSIIGNSDYLQLVLKDGWFYQARDNVLSQKKDQRVRFHFDYYTKLFPLWRFENESADSLFSGTIASKDVTELEQHIDESITKYGELHIKLMTYYKKHALLGRLLIDLDKAKVANWGIDTASAVAQVKGADYATHFIPSKVREDNFRSSALDYAQVMDQAQYLWNDLKFYEKRQRQAEVSRNKKYVLSMACLFFFILGAPIGSIIKKGNVGLPLVIAVSIFTAFHFSNTFGAKSSQEIDGGNTFWNQWLPNILLFMVGIILFVSISDISFRWKKRRKFYWSSAR